MRCVILALLFLATAPLAAARTDTLQTSVQDTEKETALNSYTSRTTLFGIGGVNRLETYLSPLEYTGTEARFLHESLRLTRMAGGRISTQQFFEGNISLSHSPTRDAKFYAGDFGWHIGWHYNWQPAKNLRLLAGALTGANVGLVYNTRNGNNPAQAKLNAELCASVAAFYKFTLWHHGLTARYQLDVPFAGVMFSPAYGQSYYEIFNQGHSDHNVCMTWPGNAPVFRQLLTLDLPLGPGTLRLAYRSDVTQSHVNQLKSHAWSNLFMIGYVRHFRLIKDRKVHQTSFIF